MRERKTKGWRIFPWIAVWRNVSSPKRDITFPNDVMQYVFIFLVVLTFEFRASRC
jgi:hypothetical protein